LWIEKNRTVKSKRERLSAGKERSNKKEGVAALYDAPKRTEGAVRSAPWARKTTKGDAGRKAVYPAGESKSMDAQNVVGPTTRHRRSGGRTITTKTRFQKGPRLEYSWRPTRLLGGENASNPGERGGVNPRLPDESRGENAVTLQTALHTRKKRVLREYADDGKITQKK